MATGFTCTVCGKWHEGIPDQAFALPHVIYELDEAERGRRARTSEDLCSLDDEHFFVRGLLEIPILGTGDRFAYGVWSTLSRPNFDLYVDTFRDGDQGKLGPFFGWFSNRLTGYPDTLNLKCSVQPRDCNRRPSFTLEPTDHPLAVEQRNGITEARLGEILSSSRRH